MSVYYTSELLINSVKRRISIPTNQNTFTDEDILAFADEELMLSIVPAIMSLHEDYLLFSQDTPLVASQNEYVIPYRAVGNKLYDLQFFDSNRNILPMSRTTLGDQPSYNGAYTTNLTYAYYVKNNRIGLLPTFTGPSTGSLRFIYYIRPSALVFTPEICVVTNVNRLTGVVSVNKIPDTFSTNTKIDFYKFVSPHTILNIDILPLAVNPAGNNFVFSTGYDIITLSLDTVANATDGGYFIADSGNTTNKYFFWFDKTGSTPVPSQPDTVGRTAIRVDLVGLTTANQIALAIQAVMPPTDFAVNVNGTILTAQTGATGSGSNGIIPFGNDRFTLANTTQVSDIPNFLDVGDHIALAEQCAIPQIPSDLHVFLAQKTAERILEAQGDTEGLKLAQAKSAEMEVRAGTIIDNRVDESPVKLVNRYGILRSGLIQRLYRRRG